ncbi:hypothetical protein F5Y01DRAFT_325749 [Xylaria sp. FL0043]|nr:hypothetical protein F5Y01DRAFT_325749 [Xylaria sp. FL0043]
MSSSINSSGAGSGSESNTGSPELIVAIVALIISLLAFFTTTLQALQQYFASATGYASCSECVMGKWSNFTRRRMRWSEFRVEVQFTVPVIFVAPPTNRRGPMGVDDGADEGKRIFYMDGSETSIAETYTLSKAEFDRDGERRQSLRTADNELATWLDLLMAVQRMEEESRKWQRGVVFGSLDYGPPPELLPSHTLAVGLQRKVKSWDSMPAGLKKPYATTTIGHLVEIVAMLGIYWKEFDHGAQLYRGQGNGFSIRGRHIDDLGVVFTFHKTGPTWFQNHRIVPNRLVKELCFGFVPTIFRPAEDGTYLYADEVKDKKTLQLGSLAEIAETLTVFGCSIATVDYFGTRAKTSRHGHIFPIVFEMLGMIGVVFHIEGTAFRMLPNPTVFHWDNKSFSLRSILSSYSQALQNGGQTDPKLASEKLRILAEKASRVEEQFVRDDSRSSSLEQEAGYSPRAVTELRAALSECAAQLETINDLPLVESVFRVHLEEMLQKLNDASGSGGDDDGDGGDDQIAHSAHSSTVEVPTLLELDAAAPEDRHYMLAQLHVWSVRLRVIRMVNLETRAEKETISDIWCILVFRMLFWLLLHDFHGKDVQLPKSELFGNRLPVYIV